MITDLQLRPVEPTDFERIHSWAADPRASRYQTWGPNSEQETRDYVEAAVAAWQVDPQERFPFCGVDAGLVVGMGEIKIVNRRFRCGEIGYLVHPEVWGRGHGSRIATELLRYGFRELDLHRIQGTCDPRNLASAAILRKVGMRYEGRTREVIKIRDGWRDSELFAILASDEVHVP